MPDIIMDDDHPELPFPPELLDPDAYGDRTWGQNRKLPIKLIAMDNGCIVPISHKPNAYGYIPIRGERFGGKPYDFLHRLAYIHMHGSIREGWEIDHICKTRSCCNPRHLQALPKREHTFLTSKLRDADLKEEMAMLVLMHSGSLTAQDIAPMFGKSVAVIQRWLDAVEQEQAEDRERWAAMAA